CPWQPAPITAMKSPRFLAPMAVFLFVLGFVLLKGSSAFYAFVFLPDFHGSWREAMGRGLIDIEGWWAFTKSTPGLIMRGAGLASILGCGLCVWLAWRSE
ncbi:MAG: hypothetical protein ACI9X4_002161, partial [Glaciecola sp.]